VIAFGAAKPISDQYQQTAENNCTQMNTETADSTAVHPFFSVVSVYS
jgi:hypothetical protein